MTPKTHLWDQRQVLCWIVAPMLVSAALALACGAPTTPTANDGLSPDELKALLDARSVLEGRWTLQYDMQARDEVDRPVDAATFTWTLEIFEVEAEAFGGADLEFRWNGALLVGSACIASQEDLDTQSGDCQTLKGTALGRCVGHECESILERPATGFYAPATGELRINTLTGGFYVLDTERGFINFTTEIDADFPLDEGKTVAVEEECSSRCGWQVTPKGLFDGEFTSLSDNIRKTTLTRQDDTRRTTPTVDSEPTTTRIDEQSEAEAALLGAWSITLGLEDDIENVGLTRVAEVTYTMDLFQITEAAEVGSWKFDGGATATRACAAEVGGGPCEALGPVKNGSCSGGNCTESGEFDIDGFYNTLDGSLRINSVSAPAFFQDGRGDMTFSLNIVTDGGILAGDTLPRTQCQTGCNWQIRASESFDETHGDRDHNAATFEMERSP